MTARLVRVNAVFRRAHSVRLARVLLTVVAVLAGLFVAGPPLAAPSASSYDKVIHTYDAAALLSSQSDAATHVRGPLRRRRPRRGGRLPPFVIAVLPQTPDSRATWRHSPTRTS